MASAIDVSTERILRKALYAAIKDDDDEFERQLESFATKEALVSACARATDLAALVLLEQFEGRPTEEAVQKLAANAASLAEAWSGISTAEFAAFINAVFEGTPIEEVLPTGVALRVPFVFAGDMLARYHKADEEWFDFLDRLWETLEDRA